MGVFFGGGGTASTSSCNYGNVSGDCHWKLPSALVFALSSLGRGQKTVVLVVLPGSCELGFGGSGAPHIFSPLHSVLRLEQTSRNKGIWENVRK